MISGTDPLTTHTQACIAFARVGDRELGRRLGGAGDGNSEVVEGLTSGKGAPDVEIMVSPLAWRVSRAWISNESLSLEEAEEVWNVLDHGHTKFDVPEAMTISATLLRPTSKGTVTQESADLWGKPLIDPCYLSTKHDIKIHVRGVRLSHELANTEPPQVDVGPKCPTSAPGPRTGNEVERGDQRDHPKSRRDLRKIPHSLSFAAPRYHPTCIPRMAPLEDGGVVDPRLRVYGVQGLRIVDAGVQPEIVSGRTAGSTIGIAERRLID